MRDGVDQTDGRERPADDGADARHEVVPALARRAHGDGHRRQVVGELRLGHVELVVGHGLRLDERLVADGRARVRAQGREEGADVEVRGDDLDVVVRGLVRLIKQPIDILVIWTKIRP